jgi:hypothetical protein
MVELTSTSASNGTRNWYLYWYRCISSVDVFIKVGGFPRLDYDVIDGSLDRSTNVLSEHVVHAPLLCRACIPQTKWHSDVAVHAKRCDERSCELVGLFHPDLVIP